MESADQYDNEEYTGDPKILYIKIWDASNSKNKYVKRTIKANQFRSYSTVAHSAYQPYQSVGKDGKTRVRKPPAINPINSSKLDPVASSFASMDIETISLGIPVGDNTFTQIPVIITLTFPPASSKRPLSENTHIIMIDKERLTRSIKDKNIERVQYLVDQLWLKFINLLKVRYVENIFIHNLGKFDGYFLFPGLLKVVGGDNINNVTPIIDNDNRFILITYKYLNTNGEAITINFRDSYRIFPISLNKLCKTFNVAGKSQDYNVAWNQISLFKDKKLLTQFLEYAKQDTISLYNALLNAQRIYMDKYGVDIAKVVSAPSLSLLIFRMRYLDTPIPILKRSHDDFIRESYYGGATDYYKVATLNGIKLKYYDVNSLYPTAMMKPMPLKLVRVIKNMDSLYNITNFSSFFGFVKCKVNCPKGMKKPILPVKQDEKTIYPTGSWIATYFSEEIKEAIKLGYNFTFYTGFEFTQYQLFDRYVEEFYEEKRLATGNKDDAKKFISKLHLNSLYGLMGRKPDLITTINSDRSGLQEISVNRSIKKLITLTDNIFIFLLKDNISKPLLAGMKDLGSNIRSTHSTVMANVAVAAAVTSYARIHMIPFKLNYDCYYTDTDSIFCSKEIPSYLIGDGLGQMKDELEGGWIEDAKFLGLKQYGYSFIGNKGLEERSVFRGVTRNSLSLKDINHLGKGGSLVRSIKGRFKRDFAKFQITITDATLTITATRDKVIEGNNYLPPHIELKEASKSLLLRGGVGLLKGLFKLFVYHLSQVKKILSK